MSTLLRNISSNLKLKSLPKTPSTSTSTSISNSVTSTRVVAPSSSSLVGLSLSTSTANQYSSSTRSTSSAGSGHSHSYSHSYRTKLAALGISASALALAAYSTSSSSQVAEAKGSSILEEINERLIRIEDMMTTYGPFLQTIETLKKENPSNLMAKNFDPAYFASLKPELKARLYKICRSGAENPDSGMGCYAMSPDDYDTFKPFFDKVIRDYHKIDGEVKHKNDWNLESVKDKLPAGGKLDLTKLGLGTTSMRVRVGRNLEAYPLPGAMTKEDRLALEQDMIQAFKKLMADPNYGGTYYSITPGTEYTISDEKYNQLVKDHVFFKDMASDPFLASAGIASDWPYGRGCYVSEDGGFIVWVGEEDQLRIMCMKKGTELTDVFNRLKSACDVVEQYAGKFAHSKDYGYVTSCPTNLGTGMRASVHIKVPNLTSDGTDKKAKEICKPLGLSVRGVGGEHTPIGKDGTIDLSPSARLMITEAEIVAALYEGIEACLKEENKVAKL